MSNNDQFEYWRGALAGSANRDLIKRGDPQSGYYRDKNRAVAIWRNAEDGALCCSVSSGYEPRHADEIDDLFSFCCTRPISYQLFQHVCGGGDWPEHVAIPEPRGIGDNSDERRELHEIILGQINDLADSAAKWFKEIGGEITTTEQADKASNYAAAFNELEKKADEARKNEKKPLDEQVKKVQTTWTPIIDRAADFKTRMKQRWADFAAKERKRIEEEEAKRRAAQAAAAKEAAQRAIERGEEPPAPPAIEEPLGAGRRVTGKGRASVTSAGGISLKTRTKATVTDEKALIAYFATLDPVPADLVEPARIIALKLYNATGAKVPGVDYSEETYGA